jgi:hypothetical protein
MINIRVKPSNILEEQVRIKEEQFELVKRLGEMKQETGEIKYILNNQYRIPKNANLEILGIKKQPSVKKNIANPKELQERFERENRKAEEREKLRLIEKLQGGIKKKKLPSLNTTEKRLMDSLTSMKNEFAVNDKDKAGQNNNHLNTNLKKPIETEKIEIRADSDHEDIDGNNTTGEFNIDEKLDSEFIKHCSKDKMSFFYMRLRDVYDFLMSIRLFRYIEIFIEDGFEDMETLLQIDQEYFKEREYPPEHKIRILNKVAELKGSTDFIINNEKEVLTDTKELAKLTIEKEQPVTAEFCTEANLDNLLPLNIEKQACWNCLKVIVKDLAISHYFDEKLIKLKVV